MYRSAIVLEEMPPCSMRPRDAPCFRRASKRWQRVAGALTSFRTHSPASLQVVTGKSTFVTSFMSNGFPYKDQIEEIVYCNSFILCIRIL